VDHSGMHGSFLPAHLVTHHANHGWARYLGA
jgi:hypothetical protein